MSRIKLVLMGLLAALAVSAAASASASAGSLHYYHSGGTKLTEGSSLPITSLGGLQVLIGVAAGVEVVIHCEHLDNSGNILNPTGGGPGDGLQTLLYLGCIVSTFSCKLPEDMITATVQTVLIGTAALPEVLFLPDGAPTNKTFVDLTFHGCTVEGLNTTFKVTGSALGMINNTTSGVKVNEEKEHSSMLKFAGAEASLTGTEDIVEMEGGGAIEVKE